MQIQQSNYHSYQESFPIIYPLVSIFSLMVALSLMTIGVHQIMPTIIENADILRLSESP